ncbi:MAG: zinc ABC transporter solute-binding protein [Planctomycetes bacterium]|nr:zinc ABC transporter solute-binding protein [Planctomycetota bacterium]
MNRIRLAVLLVLVLAAVWIIPKLAAKSPSTPKRSTYVVTCTTGMVTDIVRQIVGDKGEVTGIIGPGIDPHLYTTTRNDVARLVQSDIIFYSGLMLEGKMGDALNRVGRKRPVYAVTELIDKSLLLEPPEFAGHFDPHVWMDVGLWKRCTEMVTRALCEFDAPNAEYYRNNFKTYTIGLDRLDAYAKKSLATIPKEHRVLVTAHDAFNYFSRAYNLEVKGIQGISTESEAGIADINRLVELISTRGIKAVFVESSVSSKNIKALIEGAASRGHAVVIGGTLFSDAMGQAGSYEGTYIGMIDHNVTVVTRALGGKADAGGMQGKLSAKEK